VFGVFAAVLLMEAVITGVVVVVVITVRSRLVIVCIMNKKSCGVCNASNVKLILIVLSIVICVSRCLFLPISHIYIGLSIVFLLSCLFHFFVAI